MRKMKKYFIFFVIILLFSSCDKKDAIEKSGFAFIEGGTYLIGSEKDYKYKTKGEEDKHYVTINSFYISRTEITNKEYNEIMGLPSTENDNYPVVNVSWIDAIIFCNKKSTLENIDCYYELVYDNDNSVINVFTNEQSQGYRLPTMSEWEIACRAGTDTPFYTGRKLKQKQANINSESLMPVASYPSNKNGLFDIYGNADEWCWDLPQWTNKFYEFRFIKGGNYECKWYEISSSSIYASMLDTKSPYIGFRIARNAQNN